MKSNDLVIDESNFKEYFFDVRLNKPQRGQVMATYTAVVELLDGPEKRQIIEFLRFTDKALAVVSMMRKALLAKDPYTFSVPIQMAQDLLNGKSEEEVRETPYKFVMEAAFWTQAEYIPMNDPHWACVSILNLEEHFAKKDESFQIKSRLMNPNECHVSEDHHCDCGACGDQTSIEIP